MLRWRLRAEVKTLSSSIGSMVLASLRTSPKGQAPWSKSERSRRLRRNLWFEIRSSLTTQFYSNLWSLTNGESSILAPRSGNWGGYAPDRVVAATRTTQFFTEQARITAAQIFTPSIGRQSLPLLLRKDSYYVRLPLRVDQGN